MSRNLLLLFSLLSALMCQSQDTFLPGYIVTSSGDTTKGFVLEGSPSFASQQCLFKTDLTATVQEFEPGKIQSVFFSNRLYRSKKIKYDVANQAFFLECLFDGKVDLYKLSRLESDYYFAERGDTIFPLTHTRSEVYSKGKKVQLNTKIYIGVLKWLMQDHTNFGHRIEAVKLEDLSLIDLFSEYHSHICDVGCVSYVKMYPKREKKRWKLGIGGSIQIVSRSMQIETVVSVKDLILGSRLVNSNANLSTILSSIVPALQLSVSDMGGRTFTIEFKYLSQNDTEIRAEFLSMPLFYQKQFLFGRKISPYFLVGVVAEYYFDTSVSGRLLANGVIMPARSFDWTGLGLISPTVGLGLQHRFINGHQMQLEARYETAPLRSTSPSTVDQSLNYTTKSTLSTTTFLMSLSYQLFANRN